MHRQPVSADGTVSRPFLGGTALKDAHVKPRKDTKKVSSLKRGNIIVVDDDEEGQIGWRLRDIGTKRALSDSGGDDTQKLRGLLNNPPPHNAAVIVDLMGGRDSQEQARSLPPSPARYALTDTNLSRGPPAPAMSSRSRNPGQGQREDTQNPQEPSSVIAGTSLQPVLLEDEDDDYENEGKVIAARRVTPNATGRGRHHSRTPWPPESIWEALRHSHGDASEHKSADSPKNMAAPNSDSLSYSGLGAKKRVVCSVSVARQVAMPIPAISAIKDRKTKPKYGAYNPMNRLSTPNPNSAHVPQTALKPFDFTSQLDDQPPNKRQKLDGPMVNGRSHREFVNGDSIPADGREIVALSTGWSGYSQTENGERRGSGSRRSLERLTNPNNHSQTRAAKKIKSHGSQDSHRILVTESEMTVVRMDEYDNREDREDPISDEEIEEVAQQKSSSSLRVVIPRYTGSAFLMPARKSSQAKAILKPFLRSKSSRSNPRDEPAPEGRPPPHQKSKINPNTRRKRLRDSVNTVSDTDPLADDSYADNGILDTRKKAEEQSDAIPKSFNVVHDHYESSGDELNSIKDVDIPRQVFTGSGKFVSRKSGAVEYYVVQFFSQAHVWLPGSDDQQCLLLIDPAEKNFTITIDSASTESTGIDSFQKIQWAEDDPRIIIHKSRDGTFRGATQLYVNLGIAVHSKALVKYLESICRTIKLYDIARNSLKNTFTNIKDQAQAPSRNASTSNPDDIQFIKEKAANRQRRKPDALEIIQNFVEVRDGRASQRGPRLVDGLKAVNEHASQESQSRQKSHIARSLSNQDDIEITPASFYAPSNISNTHKIRSSSRLSGQDSTLQAVPKERTPSPERWSVLNKAWRKEWKGSVVYPAVGKKKATVDMQDIQRLDEGEFLNDNLISFYLRWLEYHLPEVMAKRIYFQNTFFYERLTTGDKKGSINYEAVRRWTSKVDLLSFDYIIVPVNEHAHWYVAIICNPSKLQVTEPEPLGGSQTTRDSADLVSHEEPTHIASSVDAIGSSSYSPTSAKTTPKQLPEPEVEGSLKNLSLDAKYAGGLNDSKLPEDGIPHKLASRRERIGSRGNDDSDDVDLLSEAEFGKVTSDIPEKPVQKSGPMRKGKKKPIPSPPKKNDPKEARIVTFDSLGSSHSPTCTRLRDYLVAEFKDKQKIDVPPRNIGMCAKGIPEQNNFCDCGLFLLGYVEKFLGDPDEFIEKVLQRSISLDEEWPKAPDMRRKIRNLLFEIQGISIGTKENAHEPSNKAKKELKAERKGQGADISNPKPSQTSRSAGNSPILGRPDTEMGAPKMTLRHATQKRAVSGHTISSRKSASIDLGDNSPEAAQKASRGRFGGDGAGEKLEVNDSSPTAKNAETSPPPPSEDIEEIGSIRNSETSQPGPNLFRRLGNLIGIGCNHEKARPRMEAAQEEPSESAAVEVPESPPSVLAHPRRSLERPHTRPSDPAPTLERSSTIRTVRGREQTPFSRIEVVNGYGQNEIYKDAASGRHDLEMQKAPYADAGQAHNNTQPDPDDSAASDSNGPESPNLPKSAAGDDDGEMLLGPSFLSTPDHSSPSPELSSPTATGRKEPSHASTVPQSGQKRKFRALESPPPMGARDPYENNFGGWRGTHTKFRESDEEHQ